MAKLLPCPFCGADMMYVRFHTVKFMKPTIKAIVCHKCGAMMSADMNELDEPSEVALQDYILEKWDARTPKEKAQNKMDKYELRDKILKLLDCDMDEIIPAIYELAMVVAPASWSDEVWDDINRMRTLNTTQSQRRQTMHVCPLQLDIVERLINRYSNKGDVIFDPFAGLFTVPKCAVEMGRYGIGTELNVDYFRDGVGYLKGAETDIDTPTLFDFMEEGGLIC